MTSQDFRTAAGAAIDAPAANPAVARDLLSGASARPCFVVGRNEPASGLIGRLRLNGLVDDFAQPGSDWRGLPVVATAQLPADAIVINCSTSISPVAVEQRLQAARIGSVRFDLRPHFRSRGRDRAAPVRPGPARGLATLRNGMG